MNFTRDPMIETIITPKEGFRLVIRCSKGGGHEEFVVDSVQVIVLGVTCFYRSLEKPKPFLVPAADYEIVEVRETRMVMKLPAGEKGGIKIGGGRETSIKREVKEEEESPSEPEATETPSEARPERRKEKKRFRRRRGFEPGEKEEGAPLEEGVREEKPPVMFIPPPSTLISETIARYKDIPGFASAFFEKEKEEEVATTPTASEENREDEDFFL